MRLVLVAIEYRSEVVHLVRTRPNLDAQFGTPLDLVDRGVDPVVARSPAGRVPVGLQRTGSDADEIPMLVHPLRMFVTEQLHLDDALHSFLERCLVFNPVERVVAHHQVGDAVGTLDLGGGRIDQHLVLVLVVGEVGDQDRIESPDPQCPAVVEVDIAPHVRLRHVLDDLPVLALDVVGPDRAEQSRREVPIVVLERTERI